MPAKTDIGFPGFMWRKNIHDDLATSGTISTCSSIGQSDMKECLKLFRQDGKKSTFKETSGEWKNGEPIVKVKFAFPVLVKQVRIVHAAMNKEECRPKSLTLKFSSGERKVDVDNIENKLNIGNGMFLQYDIKPFAADEISVVVVESQKIARSLHLRLGSCLYEVRCCRILTDVLAGVDTLGNLAVVVPLANIIKAATGKDSGPNRKGPLDATTYIMVHLMESLPLTEKHGRRHIQIKLGTIGIVDLEVGYHNPKLS